MCISDFVLEYKIYRLLKKLSRQRAVVILQPGNVPVIEKAVSETEENDWIFYTCLMRGWIEVLQENVPTGALTPKGELPSGEIFTKNKNTYRLTDSGWAAINRSHQWVIFTALISVAAVLISVFGR